MQRGQAMLSGPRALFSAPSEQLQAVRRWNAERRWGLVEADFDAVRGGPPPGPRRPLVADVLAVFLEGTRGTPAMVRTFRELLAVAFAPFDGGVCWDGYERPCADTIRPAEGSPFPGRGLRWERIDLGADRGIAPSLVGPGRRPGLCLLAASALHPRWVAAMDGQRVPYVWLAGLDVCMTPAKPWSAKPRLGFSQPTREVRLHAIESWRSHPCWSVPAYA